MAQSEFHDLAELHLNINPTTQAIESSWGNLGYWKDSNIEQNIVHYPKACQQLAMEVAFIADLNAEHKLLDTGFGCGDQLLIWIKEFNVKNITGLNLSSSQTQFAQENLDNAPLNINTHCEINTADCCLESSWQELDDDFQRIIALDCIYHFKHKFQYFNLCERHLANNGALVVSDLLLAKEHLPIWHKLLLKSICYLSHIPYQNFKTTKQYQQQLATSGLTITQQKDISEHVFLPFGQWLAEYIPTVKNSPNLPKNISWLKYKGTAKFLAWGFNQDVFRYYVLKIERGRLKGDN